jgi:hypothetical protein
VYKTDIIKSKIVFVTIKVLQFYKILQNNIYQLTIMKNKTFNLKSLFFVSAMALTSYVQAQEKPTLDATSRKIVVDSMAAILTREYVFPEIGSKMADKLQTQLKKGFFDKATDVKVFADLLTQEVRSINHDLHLRVNFNPAFAKDIQNSQTDSLQAIEIEKQYLAEEKRRNFGFEKVEILKGNIGYIKLNGFAGDISKGAGETAIAAMNFVANTEAVIFDLRQNGGGSPEMIQLLSSYLFDVPVHLNSFYFRPNNQTTQTWTFPHVQGKKITNTPVYILTSNYTFSAAEEFTYNLKNLKRATIVGETTGGGAHPGGMVSIANGYVMFVPNGKAINPITNTNWEGTGIAPHVEIPKYKALHQAQLLILQDLAKKKQAETETVVMLNNLIDDLKQNEPKTKKIRFALKGYENAKEVYIAGSFNSFSRQNPMKKEGSEWVTEVDAEMGKVAYKFIVDGVWVLDPSNPKVRKEGRNENSVVEVQ